MLGFQSKFSSSYCHLSIADFLLRTYFVFSALVISGMLSVCDLCDPLRPCPVTKEAVIWFSYVISWHGSLLADIIQDQYIVTMVDDWKWLFVMYGLCLTVVCLTRYKICVI
jgi:hypothetical protein